MDPIEPDAFEDELADLLEAYDEALAAGRPPDPAFSSAAPAGLRAELEGLQACLRFLERSCPRSGRSGDGSAATPAEADASAFQGPHPPARLGRFEVIRLLGGGGCGLVYLAWDFHLRRSVAVKVPRPETLLSPDARRRFLREAQTAAGLDHPHLVPVHEAGEDGAAVFLVSAYCPGPTLAAWLKEQTAPVPVRDAARFLIQLAGAADYLHRRGVLHRDLKPANILLARATPEPAGAAPAVEDTTRPLAEWIPKVTDFGLARDEQRQTQLTRTGALVGTALYMAPEQARARHEEFGPATDVWALGVILYELLIGRPPFQGGTDVATLELVLQAEPIPPRRLRRDLPRDLETICLRCLEKEPRRRYSGAAALAEDLERFLDARPILARPVGARERLGKWLRRRPAVAGLLGALTVALVGLGLTGWYLVASWNIAQQESEYRAQAEQRELDAQRRLDASQSSAERDRANRSQAEERELDAQQRLYASRFRVVVQNQDATEVEQVVTLLDKLLAPPGQADLRGFEWYYLKGRCRPSRWLWQGHQGHVFGVAASRDGKTVATVGQDKTVRLWDPVTGRLDTTLQRTGEGRTISIACSPDGQTLAWVEESPSRVVLWDRPTARERAFSGGGEESHTHRIALDNDSRTLAAARYPGCGLWPLKSDKPPVFLGTGENWDSVAFSPDGRLVARGGYSREGRPDFRVCLYDVQTGKEGHILRGHDTFIFALAFSPEGSGLASGDRNGTVKLWDIASGDLRATWGEPRSQVHRLAYSPDGRTLAWVGALVDPKGRVGPGFLQLWDLALTKGPVPVSRERFPQTIHDLAFAPDGAELYLPCADGRVYVVPVGLAPGTPRLPGHAPKEAWSLAFSPDGRTLASAGDDHQVRLWDLATGQERAVLQGHEQLVTTVAWAPDGRTVASASFDQTVRLWDAETGRHRVTWPISGTLRGLAFSPDSRTLVVGSGLRVHSNKDSSSGAVRLLDTLTGRERPLLDGLAAMVHAAAFSPDGTIVAAACGDGKVRLWDTATGQPRDPFADTAEVWCLAFSPDGRTLASGNQQGLVRLWEVATGRERSSLRGHGGGIESVAFSPDGRTLASGSHDKTVRLWQAATGEELLVLRGHTARVNAVAFAPSSRVLASADHDGAIRLWRGEE